MSIIGLQVARDNNLRIKRLETPRKIIEASGGQLDIVGQTEMFVKLKVLSSFVVVMSSCIVSLPNRGIVEWEVPGRFRCCGVL